jgi:hypothetical protein
MTGPWLFATAAGAIIAAVLATVARGSASTLTEMDSPLPAAAMPDVSSTVTYADQIAAIMAIHCNECHSSGESTWKDNTSPSGGLDTTTLDGLVRGGRSGKAFAPRTPGDGLLTTYARDGHMRDVFGAQRLGREDLAALKTWIEGGAPKGNKVWPVDRLIFRDAVLTDALYLRYRLSGEAAVSYRIIDTKDRLIAERRGAVSNAEGALSRPGNIDYLAIIPEKNWPSRGDVIVSLSYARQPLAGSLVILTSSSGGNYDGYWGFAALRLPEEWSTSGTSAYGSVWTDCAAELDVDLRDSLDPTAKAISQLSAGNVPPGLHQIEIPLTRPSFDHVLQGHPYVQFSIIGGKYCDGSVVVMAPNSGRSP